MIQITMVPAAALYSLPHPSLPAYCDSCVVINGAMLSMLLTIKGGRFRDSRRLGAFVTVYIACYVQVLVYDR